MDRTDRHSTQPPRATDNLGPHRRPGECRGPAPLARCDARHWIPAFAGMTSRKGGARGSLLWQLLAIPLLWLTLQVGLASPAHAQEKITYYYTDFQGTVLAETDDQGNIAKEYDYRPYGEQVLGEPANGPGYTGHVNDADTDLLYMQARYYDPLVGRFLSVDPKAPEPGNLFGFNRYAYANNSPLNFVDPDGREAGYTYLANGGMSISYMHREFHPAIVQGTSLALDQVPIAGSIKGIVEAGIEPTPSNVLGAAIGIVPGGGALKGAVKAGSKAVKEKAIVAVAESSNAARRESMRKAGIPTSQSPVSTSKNDSGFEYSYDVPKEGGGTKRMSVQQQTMDRSHPGENHWEAGRVKVDDNGQVMQNAYGRPALKNLGKVKVDY
ncbi:MAG TPA: RHS repeat-associated core domain-containing protein [Dyella sp.]|uniref:RHS repeat domain-containing protein n=1 Tax=Dyella sp. TaxID=1869338 RepID=UPI002F959D46